MSEIKLKNIIVKKNSIYYDYEKSNDLLEYFNDSIPFYIEYQTDINFENVPTSILSIPFFLNFLPLALVTNAHIYIEEIDKTLYNSLPFLIEEMKKIFFDANLQCNYTFNKIIENTYTASNNNCILFSGGVDAITTVLRHKIENPVLINIWGADVGLDDEENHKYIEKNCIDIANKLKLNFITVKSSLRYHFDEPYLSVHFYDRIKETWWQGMQHSIGLLSLLAPYNYINKTNTNYIASSFIMDDYQKNMRSLSYPFVDEKFVLGGTKTIHDGFELNRQQKINYITKQINDINLNVCYHPKEGKNCNSCEKCFRTIMAIIATKSDPNKYGFKVDEEKINEIKKFLNIHIFTDSVYVDWKLTQDYYKQNYEFWKINGFEWFINIKFKRVRFKLLKNIYKKLKGLIK